MTRELGIAEGKEAAEEGKKRAEDLRVYQVEKVRGREEITSSYECCVIIILMLLHVVFI